MKYKVEVERSDEYEIDIDPAVWTDEELKNWSSTFCEVQSTDELAEEVARRISINSPTEFIEGFGHLRFLNYKGELMFDTVLNKAGQYVQRPLEDCCPGIVVKVVSHDYEYHTELTLIEQENG